jgi:hypothetical protein
LLFTTTFNQSCEKDDICGENTPTTPLLVIEFFDALNLQETKNLSKTFVYGLNDNSEIVIFNNVQISSGSSVSLPLRMDNNATRIGLHMDFDESDPQAGNLDIVDISYVTDLVYISRACGYKTIYTDLDANRIDDTDNWIQDIEIIKDTIENEIEAHVKIYH